MIAARSCAGLAADSRRARRRAPSPNASGRGVQEAPVASSSTARASSFRAPNSSAKLGSTEAGLAAQRAYCSPRNAAFAPEKAEARISTPAIRPNSSLRSAPCIGPLAPHREPRLSRGRVVLPAVLRRPNQSRQGKRDPWRVSRRITSRLPIGEAKGGAPGGSEPDPHCGRAGRVSSDLAAPVHPCAGSAGRRLRALPTLRHEGVELGLVLGETEAFQERREFLLLFLEPSQGVGTPRYLALVERSPEHLALLRGRACADKPPRPLGQQAQSSTSQFAERTGLLQQARRPSHCGFPSRGGLYLWLVCTLADRLEFLTDNTAEQRFVYCRLTPSLSGRPGLQNARRGPSREVGWGTPLKKRPPPGVTGVPKLVAVVKPLARVADLVTVTPTAHHALHFEVGQGDGPNSHAFDPYGVRRHAKAQCPWRPRRARRGWPLEMTCPMSPSRPIGPPNHGGLGHGGYAGAWPGHCRVAGSAACTERDWEDASLAVVISEKAMKIRLLFWRR